MRVDEKGGKLISMAHQVLPEDHAAADGAVHSGDHSLDPPILRTLRASKTRLEHPGHAIEMAKALQAQRVVTGTHFW